MMSEPMNITGVIEPLEAAVWTQSAMQDSVLAVEPEESMETAYDSIWAGEAPTADLDPLEKIMLAEDKLYVVLAVVLIIWFGILLVLFRSDRRIARLEKTVAERSSTVAADHTHSQL
jgi:hypothetical protein